MTKHYHALSLRQTHVVGFAFCRMSSSLTAPSHVLQSSPVRFRRSAGVQPSPGCGRSSMSRPAISRSARVCWRPCAPAGLIRLALVAAAGTAKTTFVRNRSGAAFQIPRAPHFSLAELTVGGLKRKRAQHLRPLAFITRAAFTASPTFCAAAALQWRDEDLPNDFVTFQVDPEDDLRPFLHRTFL